MNIKTKKNILAVYTAAAFALGIVFSVWRTILLKQNYDPYDGTFEIGSGDILQTFEYLLLLACLIMITAAFFAGNISFKRLNDSDSGASVYIGVSCGIIFTATAVFSLFYYFDDLFFKTRTNTAVTKICTILAFFLIFFVALYFFMFAMPGYNKKKIKTAFSLFLPLFALTCMISSYFNSDFTYNDFNRITCHISLLSILFFSLSEARLALGRPAYKFNFITSLVCIICIPSYILPVVVLSSFWEMNFTFTLLFEMSQIAFLIYAVASAVTSLKSMTEAKTEKQI